MRIQHVHTFYVVPSAGGGTRDIIVVNWKPNAREDAKKSFGKMDKILEKIIINKYILKIGEGFSE